MINVQYSRKETNKQLKTIFKKKRMKWIWNKLVSYINYRRNEMIIYAD